MSKLDKAVQKAQEFDFIRFSFSDLNGTSRGQVVSARNARKCLDNGISVWEGCLLLGPRTQIVSVKDAEDHADGNITLSPSLDTLQPAAWAGEGRFKVGEVLCDTMAKHTHIPQKASPRYVAKKQLEKLSGLGLDVLSGFEIEFSLFDKKSGAPLFPAIGYMSHFVLAEYEEMLFEMEEKLASSAIDVERLHIEHGQGMFEAVMTPKYGLESGDMTFRMKEAMLEMADKKGLQLSFMSKVNLEADGTGAHFSLSLWSKDTKANAFYDASSPDELSDTARHWVAGLMKHGGALTALFCPTTNCYRRLFQPWAPAKLFWGIEDRHSAFRVKNHGPSETLVENRIPGAKSNPYLVMAATLAAGFDGLVNKLECPPLGKTADTPDLPHTLADALEALRNDSVMVEALGVELVEWFIRTKKEVDIKQAEALGDSLETERNLYF